MHAPRTIITRPNQQQIRNQHIFTLSNGYDLSSKYLYLFYKFCAQTVVFYFSAHTYCMRKNVVSALCPGFCHVGFHNKLVFQMNKKKQSIYANGRNIMNENRFVFFSF